LAVAATQRVAGALVQVIQFENPRTPHKHSGWRSTVSPAQYNTYMRQHRLHSAFMIRAILAGMIAAIAGGCWEEIRYTGPDPSLARRGPDRQAEPESTGSTTDGSGAGDDTATEQPSLSEQETPPESTEVASTPIDEVKQPEVVEADTEDAPPENASLDEPEAEPTPPPPIENEPVPEAPPPDPTLATRLAAWQLGSKLTLAALAHDRGLVPDDVASWFSQARTAAEKLGTSVADLPAPASSPGDAGSHTVHDYLFQQGQRIWRDLTDHHGADHAALFEAAVKSNVLLVLYQPGSPSVEPLTNSIRDAASKAELPAELFQPLLDTLAQQSPAAAVRVAVRKLHTNVERYLSQQAEQR
jgi:hypothetical protein